MKTVFIVDDDPQVFEIIKTMLGKTDLSLRHFENGQTCWDVLQNGDKPDLIVLDIMMPQLSGMALCQKIKKSEPLNKIKILMLSAKDSQKDRLAGLIDGADDYVTKPFHIASLSHKIQYMLSEAM
jgi:two-component system alkaline phosphatase synthesis response regulator PhoP